MHNESVPENSLLSFYKAKIKKIPIELDIRMLKDKSIVVFHDKNTKRMTGINKNIEKCNYEQIKDMKLKNTNERIPLLKDVLNLINEEVLILIELKNKKIGLEKELIKLLDNYNNFLIHTFNKRSIIWFIKNRPNYINGLLIINYVFFQKIKGLNFLSIPIESTYKIEKIKLPVFIWNIDSKIKYEIAKKYNASFIVDYHKIC